MKCRLDLCGGVCSMMPFMSKHNRVFPSIVVLCVYIYIRWLPFRHTHLASQVCVPVGTASCVGFSTLHVSLVCRAIFPRGCKHCVWTLTRVLLCFLSRLVHSLPAYIAPVRCAPLHERHPRFGFSLMYTTNTTSVYAAQSQVYTPPLTGVHDTYH